MQDQISYLENLLEGYKERYKRGETSLLARIQATAAQLDEAKLIKSYEKTKTPAKPSPTVRSPRGCCRGR